MTFIHKYAIPTSLIHVTTFADVWVAKPGFNLIFLSKKVNETYGNALSTSEN